MKEKIFFLFFFVLFICASQNTTESHESVLRELKNSDLDSFYNYGKRLQNSKNICERLLGKNAEIYYNYRLNNFREVEKMSERVLHETDSILKITPNLFCILNQKASTLNRAFWTYKNLEEYEKAYHKLDELSDFVKSIENPEFNTFYYLVTIDISRVYIKNELGMEDESVVILKRLLSKIKAKENEIDSDLQNSYMLSKKADVNNLLGQTYLALGRKEKQERLIDSGSQYFGKAYEYAKLFNPPHPDTDLMYALKMTEVRISQEKYLKALKLINDYSKINNGYKYKEEEFLKKAICYHNLKQSDSAIFYAQKLIHLPNLKKSCLITGYDILSNEYKLNKKLDSAFKYSELTLKEFDNARAQKDKTYQLLYDNDIEKIKQLNRAIIAGEKSKNKNIILLSMLIILGGSVFYLLKRKKYKKEFIKKDPEEKQVITEKQDQKEVQKVAYNIDVDLENKILAKIDATDKDLSFLSSDFTINTLAKELETNSTYISFIFNKAKKETFKQYYSRKKIEYIVALLKENKVYRNYSVQALAEEVGYANASAFARVFKKYMDSTPSAFIKNLKE